MKYKMLLVAEIEVAGPAAKAEGQAEDKLDAFREAVLPSENYGLCLYRVSPADISAGVVLVNERAG